LAAKGVTAMNFQLPASAELLFQHVHHPPAGLNLIRI
jgi:hypothetical protein